MLLMVSSLSPHSLYLLFCWVLSILTLIWLVLMALSCAAIRRAYVSRLTFPFLSHVQVFSCEMLFISRLNHPYICFPSHFCFLVAVILLSFVLSVSMRQCCLQCWQVLFFPLFLKHIVGQRRLWDAKPYALSLVFLFFGPLSISLSRFSWFCRWSLWLHLIFCTYLTTLLTELFVQNLISLTSKKSFLS